MTTKHNEMRFFIINTKIYYCKTFNTWKVSFAISDNHSQSFAVVLANHSRSFEVSANQNQSLAVSAKHNQSFAVISKPQLIF